MYSIRLYIDITTSRSFALSVWILFLLLMQSVNGAQFLNVICLFLASAFFDAVLHLLQWLLWFPSRVCTHHCHHKELTYTSSFWAWFDHFGCILHYLYNHSPQPSFFVLNFDGWLIVLSSKSMIFWYSILFVNIYDYDNRSSSIICCCFSGGMYISLGILVSCCICTLWRDHLNLLCNLISKIPCFFCCFMQRPLKHCQGHHLPAFLFCQKDFVHTYCPSFCNG